MKPSKTTLYGTTAAISYAAAQVPSLPGWMRTGFEVGAAVSMAMLGRHAADCPANCPGTGPDGRRPADPRQLRLPITAAGILVATALMLCACVTENPRHTPANPEEPAYIVSPQLAGVSNAAVQIAREVGTLTNTGPLLVPTVVGAFTAIAGISGLIAQQRSHRRTIKTLTAKSPRPANSAVDTSPVSG